MRAASSKWLAIALLACSKPPCDAGPDALQIGFDAPFTVTASCATNWRQRSGPPVALQRSADGRSARGRTPPLPSPLPWGVVPLSFAATQIELEAVEAQKIVRISAAARSSGLPSVAVGHALVLGGEGWHVVAAPPGARATVAARQGWASFTPDGGGRWRLADASGRELALRAGRYDDTPLDCGRSECHPNAARFAAESPMTHVLARELDAGGDVRCALACHAVGEPGLDDGGFVDVQRELGAPLGKWAALPRALRRLGGVGCTACHGPGAIPERAGRWAILRAEVCAVCHDAPPRYPHVADWRTTRMAHADRDPATRAAPCAGCHTTRGFLDGLGVRSLTDDWRAADTVELGLTCAACHAAHGPHGAHALLRTVDADARLPERSRLCARCHTAAAIWLGDAVGTGIVHALPNGCVDCHEGHRFTVDARRCLRCHREPPRERGSVAARAAALWSRLVAAGAVTAGSPHTAALADSPLARAAANVQRVLDDPAAGVHNAPYARALLDDAAAVLDSQPRR